MKQKNGRIGNLPANINIMNPVPNKDAKTITSLIRKNGKVSGYELSDGRVLSKREGAQWGLSPLPPQVRPASAGCRQHLCRRPDILRGWAAGASPGVCRLYAGGNPDLSRPGEKIVKLHNFLHVCWIL